MGKKPNSEARARKIDEFEHPLVEQQRGFRMGWIPILALLGIVAFATWFALNGADN